METAPADKDINSLEDSSTGSDQPFNTVRTDGVQQDNKQASNKPKSEKINQRVQRLITRVNIYFLLFIFVVVLAGAVVFISLQQNKKQVNEDNLTATRLTAEELQELGNSDAKVGDPKQTLTIESNAIFSGQALIRGDLDVAGEIKVGSNLNLPGLNVSGASTLGQISANDLTVANNASIQGQLNVQRALSVAGSAVFGGPVTAPQITVSTLQVNDDLQLNRHIDAGGQTPSRTNGSALGSGGTSSISGTDTAGTLSVNTGGSPPAGCFATITFTQAFRDTPHVVVTPIGSAGGTVSYYVNRSSTNFSICTSTPPPAGVSFAFDYIVID